MIKWKYEIKQTFKDEKRDLTITDKEIRIKIKKDNHNRNDKWYKYKCNKCGWTEGWMVENSLQRGCGCSCCVNRTSVLGINTIWDTDRWMVALGVSEEDAKSHTPHSNNKIYVVCPDCGRIKDKSMVIKDICKRKSIGCNCSDKISYPNKFAYSLLEQLNEIYKFDHLENEYSPDWIGQKRYDNYFIYNGKEYILEMDGGWHTKDNNLSGQTKEESKDNDNKKDLKAKEHGIEVIRIDCKKSNLNYIKQNILSSKLSKIFNLSEIDWKQCEEFALSNFVKQACDLWSSGIHNIKEITTIMKISRRTAVRYLKSGSKIKWCTYQEDTIKNNKHISEISKNLRSKQVEIFKNSKSLGLFPSCHDLDNNSKKLFGTKLDYSKISLVCRGIRPHHKGFTFKYTNEIEQAI